MTFGGDYGYKKGYDYYCKSVKYHANCSQNNHCILIWKSLKCCIRSWPHMPLSSGCWQSWGKTSLGMFVSMLSSHCWSSAEIYLSLPWVVQFHEAGSTRLLSVWPPFQSMYSCTNFVLCTIVCHIPSCWELTQFLTICRRERRTSPATLQRKGTNIALAIITFVTCRTTGCVWEENGGL